MGIDLKAIQEVIDVAKRLDDKGLVNAFEGNVSVKRDGYLYITPSGKSKVTLTPEKICVIDENGEQVSGIYAPSSELKMHRAVYEMRDNIGGIVHAHPAFLTAYAMCGKPLESKCHAEMIWDHKVIEVAPYGRPGSDAIYAGVKPILDKGKDLLLLSNHGVLSVGEDVFAACNKLESVENAAKILTIAKFVGDGKYADLPEEEVQALLALD
ncbi:MAG: class II aldolase/adducin family protein [Anaerovoracaceae bacterium]|jgi:L-fuculose-phosphate aldolase